MRKIILMTVATILMSATVNSQHTYTLDKNHARLTFSARHLGISWVEGIFKSFDATLVSLKEDFSDAQITMTADIKSLNTDVDMRDNDLRDNWFEIKKFPALSFKSTSFKKINGNNYKLTGNITLHGVTRPITFNVVYNGTAIHPFTKKTMAGFTITGELNRNDFGIGGEPIPTGVAYVIKVRSNAEFTID